MENATAELADFIVSCRLGDLPEVTLVQSKRTFLNIIGCMVGGARHESVDTALAALAPWSGPAVSSLIGRTETCDPLLASLINGMSSAVYSFDDTHAQAVVHPGGPVAAALLALSEARRFSGAELMLAFTLGAEVVCRVSKAVSVAPAKAGPAWVQTGICAGIGAAAGAGKLLGLDAARLAAAMGIAACQSAGVRALTRSMCYSFMVGNAAQSGLRSAVMAQQGFTSAADGLGAAGAFAEAYSSVSNVAVITDQLGRRFEIEANTFKPYPCGVVIHPVIDACLALRDEIGRLDAGAIARVRLRVNPGVVAMCDIAQPRDPFEGQVSVQHWTAAALIEGRAGTAQSRPEKLADPSIRALRSRVAIEPDATVDRAAAHVTIEFENGPARTHRIEHCRGSEARPMSNAELEAKLRDQCADAIAPASIDGIIAACWSLEREADAGAIARLAARDQ